MGKDNSYSDKCFEYREHLPLQQGKGVLELAQYVSRESFPPVILSCSGSFQKQRSMY